MLELNELSYSIIDEDLLKINSLEERIKSLEEEKSHYVKRVAAKKSGVDSWFSKQIKIAELQKECGKIVENWGSRLVDGKHYFPGVGSYYWPTIVKVSFLIQSSYAEKQVFVFEGYNWSFDEKYTYAEYVEWFCANVVFNKTFIQKNILKESIVNVIL